jgi:hypothetical protein
MLSRGPRGRKEAFWNRLVPVPTRKGLFTREGDIDE